MEGAAEETVGNSKEVNKDSKTKDQTDEKVELEHVNVDSMSNFPNGSREPEGDNDDVVGSKPDTPVSEEEDVSSETFDPETDPHEDKPLGKRRRKFFCSFKPKYIARYVALSVLIIHGIGCCLGIAFAPISYFSGIRSFLVVIIVFGVCCLSSICSLCIIVVLLVILHFSFNHDYRLVLEKRKMGIKERIVKNHFFFILLCGSICCLITTFGSLGAMYSFFGPLPTLSWKIGVGAGFLIIFFLGFGCYAVSCAFLASMDAGVEGLKIERDKERKELDYLRMMDFGVNFMKDDGEDQKNDYVRQIIIEHEDED